MLPCKPIPPEKNSGHCAPSENTPHGEEVNLEGAKVEMLGWRVSLLWGCPKKTLGIMTPQNRMLSPILRGQMNEYKFLIPHARVLLMT